MSTLESAPGQAAPNLADVLSRNLLPDGRAQLVALHQEGMIKKVPSNQVIVTPTPTSSVKLDEMNQIIREMETGESALKRLQELDASAGIVDPAVKRKAEAEFKRSQERAQQQPAPQPLASTDGALDDKALAANMLSQAQRMELEGHNLIKEAARMKKEAQGMFPGVVPAGVPETAPATTSATKTRGRKKAVTADAVQ
jgi:hypothetical protein